MCRTKERDDSCLLLRLLGIQARLTHTPDGATSISAPVDRERLEVWLDGRGPTRCHSFDAWAAS